MLAPRFWCYLKGYLEVEVHGLLVEKFLNLAIQRGVRFWAVRPLAGGLVFHMGRRDFGRLRPVARATRSRVHVRRKLGLPFLLGRVRRRKVLTAGAILLFGGVYFFSSFVWVIEVKGLELLSEDEILVVLEQGGLRPGVMKRHVVPDELERKLILDLGKVSWAGIELRGTRAVVEVVEKTLPPPPDEVYRLGNIVAGKDGLITQVLVIAGEAVVNEGQMVRQGQTLIRATPWGIGWQRDPAGAHGSRPARGVVRALVWYEEYVEVPFLLRTEYATGRTLDRVLIRFDGREVVLKGQKPLPFSTYQVDRLHRRLGLWRNIELPVEVITEHYKETRVRVETLDIQRAKAKAIEAARQSLKARIPVRAEIVRERAEVVQQTEDFVGVRLLVEAKEEIGFFQPVQPVSPPPPAPRT